VIANISYGAGVPGEDELRLCGDLGEGDRAVELGISDWYNATALARTGAKAIAIDTDPDRIAETRRRAAAAEVLVQCIESDLADLGDVGSASCDAVIAAHTVDRTDDLSRLLRQVHRILKPSAPLVLSVPHPFAAVDADHPYGTTARTVGEWFVALSRANFRPDQLVELGASPTSPAPVTLVLRARKEGS
jgi:SAM-dependent methyltransferase